MMSNFDHNKWAFIRGCTFPALLLLMIVAICLGA